LTLGLAAALPVACLFPSYSFDEPEGGGGAFAGATATSAGGAGATSTSTTATTTSAAEGGGSTTGQGGAPNEGDCLDGLDGDADGDIDCADADCAQGYECVDDLPAGWTASGYVMLFRGEPNDVPPCPDDKPTTGYQGKNGLTYLDATCSACTCGAPFNQKCELVTDLDAAKVGLQTMQVRNAQCGVAASNIVSLTTPDPWGGVCYHQEGLAGGQICGSTSCNKAVESTAPVVSGGQCNGAGGVKSVTPPSWDVAGKTCKGTKSGGGCRAGQSCQPKPQPPFEPGLCVSRTGDLDCPNEAFGTKYLFYGDTNDARDCTSCTCGPASGGTCQMTLYLYSDPAVGQCDSEIAKFTAGDCFDIPNNPPVYGWRSEISVAPANGQCAPTGPAVPIGDVTPTDPTTVCCAP
jgi:hypothetical protein